MRGRELQFKNAILHRVDIKPKKQNIDVSGNPTDPTFKQPALKTLWQL
jgi:hypothetical protein